MKRVHLASFLVLPFTMMLFCQASWGAKAYIADTKDVQLRAGPGSQYKVIATVPGGTEVDVAKSNHWMQVKVNLPSGETKDGWLQNSSLGAYPPENVFIRDLQNENSQLKEKFTQLEQEKLDLGRREKALAEKLRILEKEHEALRSGSANYVKLKEEYDAAKAMLASTEENIQTLMDENDDLKFSVRMRWFAAGALVLFFGWVIGWFSSRSQKKRRSSYVG
jgi:SH3 domain protein